MVICSRGGASLIGSSCEAGRTVAGEVREAGRTESFGRPSRGEVPGSVLVQGLDMIAGPFFGSNLAIRVIRRSGPPTSSQGSQKL